MDFTKTNNFKGLALFKKLAGEQNLPVYIDKITPVDADSEFEKLANSSFADMQHREYPINSAANTWLSALYFLTDASEFMSKRASVFQDRIFEAINFAAEMHGIGEDIEKLEGFLSSNIKQASSEPQVDNKKYALSVEKDGEVVNYFPINNLEEISLANFQLTQNVKDIPLNLVKEASENIYEAWSKYSGKQKAYFPLSDVVKTYGEKKLVDTDRFIKAACERYEKTKDTVYVDLKEFAEQNRDDFSQLKEAAEVMYEADIANDIAYKYNDTFLDPFKESAATITEEDTIKLAKEFIEMNETVLPISALKEENVQDGIKAILGTKVASAIIEAINDSDDAIELSNKSAFKDLSKEDKNSIIEVALKRSSI